MVEGRDRAGPNLVHQRANAGAGAKCGDQLEAIGARTTEHRHLARPRHGMGSDQRMVRNMCFRQCGRSRITTSGTPKATIFEGVAGRAAPGGRS